MRRNGVQPHVAVEANSIAAIVEIVRLAGLATILPEAVAQEQTGLRILRLTPRRQGEEVCRLLRPAKRRKMVAA